MPQKTVIIKLAVPLGYANGDYCRIHSNNGSGAVDYDTPYLTPKIPLFPGGAGNYGFGLGPFGKHPFGKPFAKSLRRGFGQLPFGKHPFGIGTVLIEEQVAVTDCGEWTFALVAYDALGNVHEGTPAEVTVSVHVAPPQAQGLQKDSYDKDTDILILSVIDPYSSRLGSLPSRIWPNLDGGPYDGFEGDIVGPFGDEETATDPGLPGRMT